MCVCGGYPTVNIHLLPTLGGSSSAEASHHNQCYQSARRHITDKEGGVEDDETPQLPQVKFHHFIYQMFN